MMLATASGLQIAGRSITRSVFLSCSSFHSAMKKQAKADKKAKEREAKVAAELEVRVHAGCGFNLNWVLCFSLCVYASAKL
jgi:hypothetical protein